DGGDSDDGPGLDFGDADDDGPELVFGDDEPAVDDDPFASVDESADEPVEEVMPEFDFDAAIAAEEAENAEVEPADEVVHTPVDKPVDEAVEDEPEADDVIDTEPEVDDSEESDDALSGHIIIVDAQALTVIQALPGATVSIGQGKSRTHVFTEAIDKLVETGASVVVTANGGTENITGEGTGGPGQCSETQLDAA